MLLSSKATIIVFILSLCVSGYLSAQDSSKAGQLKQARELMAKVDLYNKSNDEIVRIGVHLSTARILKYQTLHY